MGSQPAKPKEISLGDDFGDVVVKVNGVKLEVHTDGSVLAHTNADVKKTSSGANDVATKPTIGAVMQDGTLYVGVSPDTKRAMYAMPAGAALTYTFNESQKFAQTANAENLLGHDDWRVPTKNELNVLFNNRVAIGGFNTSGYNPAGWYWSATPSYGWTAWCQRFSDGAQYYDLRNLPLSVRLVR